MMRILLILILCGSSLGCRKTVAPTGTGARDVVKKYFEALAEQDWDAAYALVHAATQKQMDRATFERSARVYRQNLGFTPGKVFIRSCDEQGEKAIAQVILSDANGSMKNRFHEGVVLERGESGWGVVLRANFGQGR
jgi:hypothetical protein